MHSTLIRRQSSDHLDGTSAGRASQTLANTTAGIAEFPAWVQPRARLSYESPALTQKGRRSGPCWPRDPAVVATHARCATSPKHELPRKTTHRCRRIANSAKVPPPRCDPLNPGNPLPPAELYDRRGQLVSMLAPGEKPTALRDRGPGRAQDSQAHGSTSTTSKTHTGPEKTHGRIVESPRSFQGRG